MYKFPLPFKYPSKNSVPHTYLPYFKCSVATCATGCYTQNLPLQKILLDSPELFCSSPYRPYSGVFLQSASLQIGQMPYQFEPVFSLAHCAFQSEYFFFGYFEVLLFFGPSVNPSVPSALSTWMLKLCRLHGNCGLSPLACTLKFWRTSCHLIC